jgi:two-component system cell cycle sensor histidine kinase/response regulator CckA
MEWNLTRASVATPSASSRSRVLVVDDDDAVRRFVTRILDEDGFVVEASATGADALTRMREGRTYDLIVADVCMPEMSGPQLVARMRQTGSHAKVLYVTGFADQLFDERNEQLWADEAFLDKPCTVQGLREAVSLLLSGQIESVLRVRTPESVRGES